MKSSFLHVKFTDEVSFVFPQWTTTQLHTYLWWLNAKGVGVIVGINNLYYLIVIFNVASTYFFLLWGLDCKILVRTAAFQASSSIGHGGGAHLIGWHWSTHGQLNLIVWKRRRHKLAEELSLYHYKVRYIPNITCPLQDTWVWRHRSHPLAMWRTCWKPDIK